VKELERVKGIEPSYAAWEAAVLPLNYTRLAAKHSHFGPSWVKGLAEFAKLFPLKITLWQKKV
jgi:hypothetical protein